MVSLEPAQSSSQAGIDDEWLIRQPCLVVSAITKESAEGLSLSEGDAVKVVIKATQ